MNRPTYPHFEHPTSRDEEPAHEPLKYSQVLGQFERVVDRLGEGFDNVAAALREKHGTCESLHAIKTDVKVLQEKTAVNSAEIAEVKTGWLDTGRRVAKTENDIVAILTTIKLVGAFIGLSFLAGAAIVSITQFIVRGHP